MRTRWRGLELPTQVLCDPNVSTNTYARMVIEPFERGFGTTVGNSLRRILLSSLQGAAVTRVRIAGASHEFMSLPGVMEDVTDIILNIKSLVIKMDDEGEKTMRLVRKGPGEVFARDLEADPALSIINPGQIIATLTEPVELGIDFWVSTGRGYRTADENQSLTDELGIIAVDSVFSPVTRVRYKTEETRVGQRTNYDRLILEIWTKGTIRPEDACVEAAKILRKHLNPFVQSKELGEEVVASEMPPTEAESAMDKALQDKLSMPISQLDLSVRASNCLESAKVATVGELARMGAHLRVEDHHLVVDGVERLSGAPVRALDIRAGAAIVVAALGADGETVVHDGQHIDRGYEDFAGKLRAIGADVERLDD